MIGPIVVVEVDPTDGAPVVDVDPRVTGLDDVAECSAVGGLVDVPPSFAVGEHAIRRLTIRPVQNRTIPVRWPDDRGTVVAAA